MSCTNTTARRSGISLLEVLISIGVISLGIFGVASLIPVAQFKVAEGTSLDRQATMGPSAAAEFRIRRMNSWRNWSFNNTPLAQVSQPNEIVTSSRVTRGVVIDPLGVIAGANYFPATGTANSRMPRVNLLSTPNVFAALRQFSLGDDLVFDRPDDQAQQPRRQYFTYWHGSVLKPAASAPESSLTWFATLSHHATLAAPTNSNDEFMLSIVLCDERIPEAFEEVDAKAQGGPFAGEVRVENNPLLAEVDAGDWLMMVKTGAAPGQGSYNAGNDPTKRIYRWVQVIGANEDEGDRFRIFSVANDDFLRPGEAARVFYMKGVASVYERTVRIENTSTAWDG